MHHFFAMASRMKYINRWALMRNIRHENLSEHSHEVAIIAHALAVIRNRKFGGNLNPERAALLGIYHDMPEILTGDMPTPVKYYNPQIYNSFKDVEKIASDELLSMLPDDLKTDFKDLFSVTDTDKELWKLVKAADKLSALIKCIEEEKGGNTDFVKAKLATRKALDKMELPEVDYFIDNFLESYSLTLDQLN